VPLSPWAGKPPPAELLIDPQKLVEAYYQIQPDPAVPEQQVSFGTSGHRGSALAGTFNEAHVVAITEAIRRWRSEHKIDGPVFVGHDTHALSLPALRTVLEVLAAQAVDVRVDKRGGVTPTPAVSRAILAHNRRPGRRADGIVITPSHNPPGDGGLKYNPPHGGPASTSVTGWIQQEANRILPSASEEVPRVSYEQARLCPTVRGYDFLGEYVDDLPSIIDFDLIRNAGLRIGVDPLGGASLAYWQAIGEKHRLELDVVNTTIDPTFAFMTVDWDGKLRMDCSSPYAMARLVGLRDRFDLALANDPDADRHGIVSTKVGLINPNHYLVAAICHLFGGARDWPLAAVGKTVVSSSLIDRVSAGLGRRLIEAPVGFKWFVEGLLSGELGFGGEESAGASFLRRDGSAWSTDKDGIIMGLLAAEITARGAGDPGQRYEEIADQYGRPSYRRVDAPASVAQRAALARLSRAEVEARELGGQPIEHVWTEAPGNGAPLEGIKVAARDCWFAARPSGTEDIYKIYAESFRGEEHLEKVLGEAQAIVDGALA
jgi:phosphoglucomutase